MSRETRNQTKIFNVVHTSATSEAYLPGDTAIYHLHTHDEPVDAKLGYQPISSKLAELAFRGYAEFLSAAGDTYTVCLVGGDVMGAYGLEAREQGRVALRWILLSPAVQGRGLGSHRRSRPTSPSRAASWCR